MGTQNDNGSLGGNEYFVPGVLVEVLWDIEQSSPEGRRRGERSVRSIWWRAEVAKVERVAGKLKAQLRYEGREGFKEQMGEVWVFPKHVRLVEDENKQRRWRFYECSGEVTYVMEDEARDFEEPDAVGCTCDPGRVEAVREQLGTVVHQYETLERLVMSQNLLFSRLLGAGSAGERQCAHVFATLRQKIAVLMQKPVPPLKVRKEPEDSSIFFEENAAGTLRVDVDCDYRTFEAIARVAKSKLETVCFRPCFADMQILGDILDEAEIVFECFGDMSRTIGITSSSDLARMSLRQKRTTRQVEQGSLDVAVRVLGTCLFDTEEDKSAMALLICKSIHEGSLSDAVDAFVRDSREYDFKSRTYLKPLIPRRSSRGELLRMAFSAKLGCLREREQLPAMRDISAELQNFTIRWRPLGLPNSRAWSRNLVFSEFVNGIVEVDIPFLDFRGVECVTEVMEFLTESFIKLQLGT